MGVPKRRTSHSRKGTRRSHDALTPAQTGRCPRCHQAAMPHRVCPNCGWYRGRRSVHGEEEPK